jgi:hypothetical protein
VEFEATPLDVVVGFLAKRAKINIVVDPRVYEEHAEDELLVTLRVRDLTLRDLLALITEPKGLGCTTADGVIHVTTREGAMGSAILRRFGVVDLFGTTVDVEPTSAELFHLGVWNEEPETDEFLPEPMTGDTLVNLVRETIDPESWDTPPNQLNYRIGQLIVRNSPAVIRETSALVNSIRQTLWRRFEVSGVFLSAPPGWVDSLGLRGPVLTPAECDRLEERLAAGGIRERGRFSTLCIPGRRFSVSGGRQVVDVRERQDAGNWESEVLLDGIHFEGTVYPALTENEVGLQFSAYGSEYIEGKGSTAKPGFLEDQRFRTNFMASLGGGAVIGASSKGTGAKGEWLLYVRIR